LVRVVAMVLHRAEEARGEEEARGAEEARGEEEAGGAEEARGEEEARGAEETSATWAMPVVVAMASSLQTKNRERH